MFTGRWPHELSAGWFTPLDRADPTLAEFLGVARLRDGRLHRQLLVLCADSGLDRGFTVYRDYIFPRLTALKTAVLVDRPAGGTPGDRAVPRETGSDSTS